MKKILLIITTFSFLASVATAKPLDFENYIEEGLNLGFQSSTPGLAGPWSLNRIRVRVKPTIGLEIPWLASFEIRPMVELYWTKKKN